MPERRWYSAAATSEYFGLKSPKNIYSLASRGRLPAGAVLKIGRQLRFDISAIEEGAVLSDGKGRPE